MKRIVIAALFSALLFSTALESFGQAWAGVIDPSRAVDWSTAGVVGDLPSGTWANCTHANCNTLFGGTVTAASISNALRSAGKNEVVRIPSGAYTIAGCISITKSNVVLRGAGANSTKLSFSGNCIGGGSGINRVMNLMSGKAGIGHGPADGYTSPDHSASWTSGYSMGATSITLSSTAGLVAGPVGTGSLMMLDQLDDASDGYPGPGDIYSCSIASVACSNQGGNQYARPGRAQVQVVTVTAMRGNTVTISPGLAYPNWRASQRPQAYWNDGSPVGNSGIENISIDFSGSTLGIFIKDAANVWVKGVRLLNTDSGTKETYHIFVLQSAHGTIRSNYFWGRSTAVSPSFPLANYPYTTQEVSDFLLENNIFEKSTTGGIVPNDPGGRNVYAYNVVVNSTVGVAGAQLHSGNIMMDLFEGNNLQTIYADVAHGSHHFITMFRNHLDGDARNSSRTSQMAFAFLTNNRFFNVIGNVAGASSYTSGSGYQQDQSLSGVSYSPIFTIGWHGNTSGMTVSDDPNVKRTLFRWGNWDSISNATRWCAPGHTGFSTTCGNVSEVPSSIKNYANAVPSTESLPPSFYLRARPSWWTTAFGTPPFPAIGPDVTGGTLSNSGGHAHRIPARLCYENMTIDPNYPSSNPRIRNYDADACYPNQAAQK